MHAHQTKHRVPAATTTHKALLCCCVNCQRAWCAGRWRNAVLTVLRRTMLCCTVLRRAVLCLQGNFYEAEYSYVTGTASVNYFALNNASQLNNLYKGTPGTRTDQHTLVASTGRWPGYHSEPLASLHARQQLRLDRGMQINKCVVTPGPAANHSWHLCVWPGRQPVATPARPPACLPARLPVRPQALSSFTCLSTSPAATAL